MWTKGVFLLGLVICWTVVCNCEDGLIDYETEGAAGVKDNLSKELAEEYLFRADLGEGCTEDEECDKRLVCDTTQDPHKCKCAPGTSGDNCEINEWCETGVFKACKGENGSCGYVDTAREVVCDCGTGGKKLHPDQNICKETCEKKDECQHGGKCEDNKFCSCLKGITGDKCETVLDCGGKGKYRGCEKSGGVCSYNETTEEAECVCKDQKQYHDIQHMCKATCQDNDCLNGGTCEALGDQNFCKCRPKVSGDKCGVVDDCQPGGEFENCNGVFGACTYNTTAEKAMCTCPTGKALHPLDKKCLECDCGPHGTCEFNTKGEPNCKCEDKYAVKNGKCEATCEGDGDCLNGGTCETSQGGNFCQCLPKVSGDTCDVIEGCKPGGEFENCKGEFGECEYSIAEEKAICTCPAGKELHPTQKKCLDCVCGENEICSLQSGEKQCSCKNGFAYKNGKCEVCTCGDNGRCSFDESGNKKCNCNNKFEVNNGICEKCDCGLNGKCDFKDGEKNCTCKLTFAFKKKDGICSKCDCGPGGICQFNGDQPECECKDGYKEFNKKCLECDCGEYGSCSLDKQGKKSCDCHSDYAVKKVGVKSICVETCNSDSDCNNRGKCEGKEGNQFCKCNTGYEGDMCQLITECHRGVFRKCEESEGKCEMKGSQAQCECYDPKKLDTSLKYCRTKCSAGNPCQNGGECKDELCVCKDGTTGDDCSTITACKSLNCEEKEATCNYDHTQTPNTFCVCTDKKYTFINNKCVEKCDDKNKCQNGGTCVPETSICRCISGTSGDKCEKIDGCDPAKCAKEDAKCDFDVAKAKPTCKCNDESYYFEDEECKPEWCKTGCKGNDNECIYIDGVGACNCTAEGKYYDYSENKCKLIKLCIDSECKGNQTCIKGACGCPDNYKKKGDNCEPKNVCDSKPCFSGSKCEDASIFGYAKCPCDGDTKYYNPGKGICEEGNCFLPGQRKGCSKSCPGLMTRKDGECKPTNDKNKCDKDCGSLGWCFKLSEEKTECRCDPTYGELTEKKDKCVLKASFVCPTNEKDGENKCKCKGLYKQASDGVTCTLRSCSDEDVQNECKATRAAKCVDNWKKSGLKVGYECVCPDGYIMHPVKGCIDPCSLDSMKDKCSNNGQVCYSSDRYLKSDCRCPPTFTFDPTRFSCDLSGENSFMIHRLPVLRAKYETTDNHVNKMSLSIDVIMSMKQAFRNLDFAHIFNSKEENDVILCDVWLQFKSGISAPFNASLEVQRWRLIKTDFKNQAVLPPALPLSDSYIDKVTEEELTLCTDSVQKSVCGRGSVCDGDKCSCAPGYRIIDSTIKALGDKRILRCEDIDECTDETHTCSENSECVNTVGDYFCQCKPGYKKVKGAANERNKEACVGLCDSNPCGEGSCAVTKDFAVDCTCKPGSSGSFCNRKDVYLAKASKATKVVGAVLGTLLAIVIILIIVYIVRQRKNSYSEDFTPAPRNDNAEMIERRPMRGVTNRAYQ